ncbi:cell division protein FtsX [Sneathiella aquimaris]|uniref:cell division protein FtsX n=1 Tax=Sneathiella aquimaris TaxID=2599305 RepID=UPI00146BF639|nr:cell division protein [Sneathiella aquimaris]
MISVFGKSAELQLEKDVSSKYLPVVISSMIFLASLALAGLFSIHSAVQDWSNAVSGNLTVEIAYEEGTNLDKKVRIATDFLKTFPGLEKVQPLDKSDTAKLLEPYLGRADVIKNLPLPRLIEVTIAEGSSVDLLAAAKKLSDAVPGAVLNTHRPWLNKMILLARSVQILAGAIMLLISIVTVIIVIFAARTGMVMHQDIIEVLHLIGAQDKYIARQFQNYFTRLSFLGALPGLFLALLVMQIFSFLAGRLDASLITAPTMILEGWVALSMLPVLVALLTRYTVRWIVLGSLKRMM